MRFRFWIASVGWCRLILLDSWDVSVYSPSLGADSEEVVFSLLAGSSSFAVFFSTLGFGFGILLTLETCTMKEHTLYLLPWVVCITFYRALYQITNLILQVQNFLINFFRYENWWAIDRGTAKFSTGVSHLLQDNKKKQADSKGILFLQVFLLLQPSFHFLCFTYNLEPEHYTTNKMSITHNHKVNFIKLTGLPHLLSFWGAMVCLCPSSWQSEKPNVHWIRTE